MESQPSRIVVLVSGSGSNLQSIIDACKDGKINGEVVAVISNRPYAYALTRADEAGIKAVGLDHTLHDDRESFEHALCDQIDECDADLIVLAGFMRILTPDFVNKYLGKMLNIHPSLLPKYPGLNTHQRAIEAGDDAHGASVHFVTPELDGGPIILQAQVPIFENDNKDELAARVVVQEHMIYPLVVSWFCDKRLTLDAGNAILDSVVLGKHGYAND